MVYCRMSGILAPENKRTTADLLIILMIESLAWSCWQDHMCPAWMWTTFVLIILSVAMIAVHLSDFPLIQHTYWGRWTVAQQHLTSWWLPSMKWMVAAQWGPKFSPTLAPMLLAIRAMAYSQWLLLPSAQLQENPGERQCQYCAGDDTVAAEMGLVCQPSSEYIQQKLDIRANLTRCTPHNQNANFGMCTLHMYSSHSTQIFCPCMQYCAWLKLNYKTHHSKSIVVKRNETVINLCPYILVFVNCWKLKFNFN